MIAFLTNVNAFIIDSFIISHKATVKSHATDGLHPITMQAMKINAKIAIIGKYFTNCPINHDSI